MRIKPNSNRWNWTNGITCNDYTLHTNVKPKKLIVTDIDQDKLDHTKQLYSSNEVGIKFINTKALSIEEQEKDFKKVLLDGNLVLSNNMAERSVKAVIMVRKNWLFSQSYEGAESSAIIMSIIETAKRYELNVEKYLGYLLEKMPNEKNLAEKAVIEAYLPWSKEMQENCK